MPVDQPVVHLDICEDDSSSKKRKNFFLIKFLDVNHEEYFEKSYHPISETVTHLVKKNLSQFKDLIRFTNVSCFFA